MANEIAELLGKDKKEWPAKIRALQRALNMPVIDMVIRYDPIPDQITVVIIGGDIAFDVAHHILDLARKNLQRDEIKASIDQQAKQNGGPPLHPDQPAEDNGEPSPESSDPADAAE